jgi:predicted N-formylglutamate amidohydrolase
MSFYLSSQEPFTFRKIAEKQSRPFLLVCDHASKQVPKSLDNLGLHDEELSRHIGWDIGAAGVTEYLAERLGAAAVLANYSRLVLDLNRSPDDQAFIPEVSDGTMIPGNANLTPEQKSARRTLLFEPYHQVIESELARLERRHPRVALVSIHSFTPQLRHNGAERPWHIGIMWKHDRETSLALKEHLEDATNWHVGDNEPYSMHVHSCYTIRRHAEELERPALMLEIRQDEIETERGQRHYAEMIGDFLETYQPQETFGDIRNRKVEALQAAV